MGVGVGVGVGVAVAVGWTVGVAVAVAVAVAVGWTVGVGVAVAVGWTVGVAVGSGWTVGVAVGSGVALGAGEALADAVGLTVGTGWSGVATRSGKVTPALVPAVSRWRTPFPTQQLDFPTLTKTSTYKRSPATKDTADGLIDGSTRVRTADPSLVAVPVDVPIAVYVPALYV
ncbi:MAG: hypothetical protein ABIS44_05965 [Mycobacteriales bacterium]